MLLNVRCFAGDWQLRQRGSFSGWFLSGACLRVGQKRRRHRAQRLLRRSYHLKEQVGLAEGLVLSEQYLVEFPFRDIEEQKFHLFTPFKLLTFLFIIIATISYRNYKAKKHWFWFDRILIFISGLLGSLFLFMWLGTDHLPAHANLNMFWAFPLNIVAFLFVKNKKWLLYFKFAAGLGAFVLLAWFLSPQQYHIAIIPLTSIYILRYLKIIDFVNK